jgi:hypothetical protein
MAAGLRQQAAARIHQQDGQVRGRGAGGHVAGVLLVAGCSRRPRTALIGGKVAIGHIDRDALFALGLQAIDQQGVVDLFSPWVPCARASTVASACSLVVEDVLRLDAAGGRSG